VVWHYFRHMGRVSGNEFGTGNLLRLIVRHGSG
jgi:hypothetical protein